MQLICKLSDEQKVFGEDWDSLMWHNGKLFSSSFANGNIKVWSADLKLITEFSAHEYPIYHMAPGNGSTFFTSSSDCTIKHWEENVDGSFRLLETLEGHSEPPRKLHFVSGKLYSGDEKGDVKVWQEGKCLGTIETMEEIWDMLAMDGFVITVRHVDVTLFTVSERDEKLRSAVKNSIPGRSPIHFTVNGLLCCIDRSDNVINVHEWEKQGNPKIGTLKGHEAIINAMSSVGKIMITGACDKSVIAWNLEKPDQEGDKLPLDGYINALAVTPDGAIYAAGENKFIACLKV